MAIKADSMPIEFECPQCGKKVKSTVGAARSSATVRCPGGHSVKMEGSELDKGLKDVDKALREFGRGR